VVELEHRYENTYFGVKSGKVTMKKNWHFRMLRKDSLILMRKLITSRGGGEVASIFLSRRTCFESEESYLHAKAN